jgi:CHAD domain-containing protein
MSKPKRATWDAGAAAAVNARRELPKLAADYFAGVRQTLAEEPALPELHRIRLATKRLRYTLELFRPCYGPGLGVRLAALQAVQRVLGEVNDCVFTANLLPKSTRAREFVDRRAAAKAAEFRTHWAEVFDAPGQERLWTAFLARKPRKR